MNKPLRLLLVEDQPVVRSGIRALLEAQDGQRTVIAEEDRAQSALDTFRAEKPDVVVTDISLPGENGIWLTRQILAEAPEAKVLVLSVHRDAEYVRAALEAGASAYVLKWAAASVLEEAIAAVSAGKHFIDPEVAFDTIHEKAPSPLSPREQEVLILLCNGSSTKAIAGELGLSAKTVETHRSHIMEKLQIFDVPGLVKYAARQGLIPL